MEAAVVTHNIAALGALKVLLEVVLDSSLAVSWVVEIRLMDSRIHRA